MRWLGLTAALLSASVALVAWVYLRDRDTTSWRPPERQLAHVDAQDALAAVDRPGCGARCTAEVLGRIRTGRWLVRLDLQGRPQCLQIALDAFAIGPRGLSGIQSSPCPAPPRAAPRPRATSG